MKNLVGMMLMLMLPLMSACQTVSPGEVAVAVSVCQSVEDGNQMNMDFIRGGRYWPAFAWCTDYYSIPIRERRTVWSHNEGSTVDDSIWFDAQNGKINMDLGLTWQVKSDDDSIRSVITNFPLGIGAEINGRVRDSVQGAFNMCAASHMVAEIYTGEEEGCLVGDECAKDLRAKVFDCALTDVQGEYDPLGLDIKRLTMNDIRLPPNVNEAMKATLGAAEAAKKAQEEVAQREAEARSEVAKANGERDAAISKAEGEKQSAILAAEADLEVAILQAKANREIGQSYTSGILEMRRLDIAERQAEKWQGGVPQFVFGEQGSTMVMTLDPEILKSR